MSLIAICSGVDAVSLEHTSVPAVAAVTNVCTLHESPKYHQITDKRDRVLARAATGIIICGNFWQSDGDAAAGATIIICGNIWQPRSDAVSDGDTAAGATIINRVSGMSFGQQRGGQSR